MPLFKTRFRLVAYLEMPLDRCVPTLVYVVSVLKPDLWLLTLIVGRICRE